MKRKPQVKLGLIQGEIKRHKPMEPAPWNPKEEPREYPAEFEKQHERGVFEHPSSFPGTRVFAIRATGGECIRMVQDPAHLVTEDSINALWDYLDQMDPAPAPFLKLSREVVR